MGIGVGWEAGALAPPKGACRSTPISCRAATTAAATVRLDREWLRGCAPHPKSQRKENCIPVPQPVVQCGPHPRTAHYAPIRWAVKTEAPKRKKVCRGVEKEMRSVLSFAGCGDGWWSAVTDVYDRPALGGW